MAKKTQYMVYDRGGGDDILCVLQEQSRLLNSICGLLRKIVVDETSKRRGPKPSKSMLRQLALALEKLQNDPLHNVSGAAEYAFRKMKGYGSKKSLEEVLRRKWNSSKQ